MLALGLAAALVASVLFNVGMALQALEARRAPRSLALKGSLLLSLLRRPLWVLGSALGVLGIAVWLLDERVGWAELVGVAAMAGGIGFVAWGAPSHVETHRDGLAVILVAAGLCAAAFAPWLVPRQRRLELPMLLVVASGCGFAASNVATKLASDDVGLHHIPNGVAWAVVVALAGIAAVLAQMTAFQVRPATVVIPVGFAVQTFLPIVLEPLFLRERLASMAYDGAPVIAGLVLLLVGT